MKASELIGKRAIRTASVVYESGSTCRSFMRDSIIIIKSTEAHIVYQYPRGNKLGISPNQIHILSREYCDDNWVDYDELIKFEPTESEE